MTSTPTTIVGRQDELGRLRHALHALPRGSFLELVGEAGIGKTRLLDELRGLAVARELLVLEGRGVEYETDVPFGILVDALDEHLNGLDPAQLARAVGDTGDDLASVFPSLQRQAEPGRFGPHRAITGLLERLPPGRGALVILDDLHWADEASVEVLAHILRRPAPRGLVLSLSRRPRHGRGTMVAALDAAMRRGLLERIELGPLTETDAIALLPQGTDAARAHRLCALSGGNPFYLEQLARVEVPATPPGAASDEFELPEAVLAALAVELDRLPAAARTLLDAAALVGEPFELDLAIAVAEQASADALDALDVLLEHDLVRVTAVPRRLRFRHPIVRRAVYESSRLGWRFAAHGRAATALAARGAPATVLARHVEQAAEPGDASAVAVLAAAGEAAAARAPAAASHWFGAALRILPEGADASRRVALLAPWAVNRAVTGRLEESRDAMIEALAALPPDEREVRTQITSFCAAIEHLLGHHEQAHRRLIEALPLIPDGASSSAAAIAVELAGDAFLQGDRDLLRTWAARGAALAKGAGEPLLEAAATAQLAFVALHDGQPEETRRLRATASARMDDVSDDRLFQRLEAGFYIGSMEYLLERDTEAIRHLERTLAVAHETGRSFVLASAGAALAHAKLRRGRVHEAADHAADAVDAARLAGNTQGMTQALAARARALLATGDLRGALAAANEGVRLTGKVEPSAFGAVPALALAAALLEAGQPGPAATAMRAISRFPLIPKTTGCEAYELLTRAALDGGDRPEAERMAARAAARAEHLDLPISRAQAGRAGALVALAAGKLDSALEAAAGAAEHASAAGAVLEEARARLLAGVVCMAANQRELAITELSAAQQLADVCGAVRIADACALELRRLGLRVPRRRFVPDGGHVASLTGREREIAGLVHRGRMNREIAAELFLSEKTVETHLRNIFVKLEAKSRHDVAAAIEREIER